MPAAGRPSAVEPTLAAADARQPTASAERRWAPRLGRMLAFTALMMVSPNLLQFGLARPDGTALPAVMLGMLALTVLFGILAHRDYVAARNALKADPSLRGGWIVENAWWVVYLVLMVPVAIGFVTALWLLGPGLGR